MFPLPSKLEWKAYLVKSWFRFICMWIKMGDKRMKRWWKLEYKPYGLQGVIHLVLVNISAGLGFFLRMSKQSRFPKTAGKGCICFVLSCSFLRNEIALHFIFDWFLHSSELLLAIWVLRLYLVLYTNTQDRQYEQDFLKLWWNIRKTYHFNHVKVYNSVAFTTSVLCCCHHCLFLEPFHHPKHEFCTHETVTADPPFPLCKRDLLKLHT